MGKIGENAMNEPITAENKKQNRQKPPLSVGRIAGEILAGTTTGFVVALPVAYVTGIVVYIAFHEEKSCFGPVLTLVSILYVSLMLYGPASGVGVYLVGSRGTQTGSFLATLGFAFIGGLVMFVMLIPVLFLSAALIVGAENIVRWTLWVLISLIPPIFATLGFNLTRRYKQPPSS